MDLADFTLFAAVARHRSFRAAAKELRLSPSSLSERIAALEQRLGLRLLNRTTRSVRPTDAGEVLLARLNPALGEIAEAVDMARQLGDSIVGTLRINAPQPAALFVIAPRLPDFLRAYPRLTLELTVDDRFVDIVEGGFDAGVRFGESLAKDMIAVPIGGPLRYVLAAAPTLLERVGRPGHPRDLIGLPCVRHRFSSGALLDWEFERGDEVVVIRPDGGRRGRRLHAHLRGLRSGNPGRRAPGGAAGRLASEFPGAVPLLPLPAPHARQAAGVHRFFPRQRITTPRPLAARPRATTSKIRHHLP